MELLGRAGRHRLTAFVAAALFTAQACSPTPSASGAPGSSPETSGPAANSPAPSGPGSPGTAVAPSGTLRIAENEPPQTLDPQQSANSTVDELMLVIYDTLVQFAPGATEVTSELATSSDVSSDGLVYTFHLQSGVKFHDGSDLTATDVKFTLDRIKAINTGVASEVSAYASSEVVDDHTIKVTLAQPYSPFLAALSRVYILNSKLVGQNAGSDNGQAWLSNHDAGSGRYQLVSYQTNQLAQFKSFPGYWKGWTSPHADQVQFQYIPDSGTQKALLDSGQIDIAMDITKDDLASYKANQAFRVDVADTLVQLYFWFNTVKGPTADPRVRHAIAMAYDYDTHIKDILLGYGAKASGPLPTSMACHLDGVTQPTFDLQGAKALLQQAGYGQGLTISISYLPVLDEMKHAFELLQSNLKQIGVNVKPLPVTFPEYAQMVSSVSTLPDLGVLYAFPASPDPNEVLYINFYSKFAGAGYNWSHYSNTALDKLLTDAQATSDPATRCDLYKQAQKIVADDYVTINASIPQYTTVLTTKVQGYKYNLAHHQTVNVPDISIGN